MPFFTDPNKNMEDSSMNHYEEQLYSVFKTFDVDNDEALDKVAVLDLCDALQLEDRSTALVDNLFENPAERVTFTQFRNGLLSVLGAGDAAVTAGGVSAAASDASADQVRPAPTAPSDDDSSGREVAPKFVFGSKKYGRRSRPQRSAAARDESPTPRAASASRINDVHRRGRRRMRFNRSSSAMENRDEDEKDIDEDVTPEELDHEKRINCEMALALCRGLRMDRIDRRTVQRIFEESPSAETTVGEFFERLNVSLATSIAAGGDDGGAGAAENFESATDEDGDEIFSSDDVVDAWARAGVERPRRLLLELGFGGASLRPLEVARVLDRELSALASPPTEPAAALLLAALALSRLRAARAASRAHSAAAERDKLRLDLAEANRRAQILAQEVDESHARIEAELKNGLRQLESRHAEAARAAAAELAEERERATAARAAVEAERARRADAEGRLRAELTVVRERAGEAESRAAAAEEATARAERELARLAAELREAERRREGADAVESATAELRAHADELRRENQRLRDRCDELAAELEAGGRRGAPGGAGGPGGASWREEAAASEPPAADRPLAPATSPPPPEECDSPLASLDHKLIGHIDSVLALVDEVGASPVTREGCSACDRLGAAVASIGERVRELGRAAAGAGAGVGAAGDGEGVALREARQTHHDDNARLNNLVQELETSLEQMKAEYDKCEEYWASKLDEEREMFNEEQRLSDERLAELVAKIGEYERQFAPRARARAPPLPAIDEARALELQYAQLERELAAQRESARRRLAERDAELARLRAERAERDAELARLRAERARPARSPAGAREAAALRARLAGAEGAVRRLHARLAAADLLVKDLYVENCQLAHAHPAPHPAPRRPP